MGVTLERVQNKFACIIGELCSEPVILSQFAIWVDLRIAEYKAKGAISLDCSGEDPEPGWLNGHRLHRKTDSRDRTLGRTPVRKSLSRPLGHPSSMHSSPASRYDQSPAGSQVDSDQGFLGETRLSPNLMLIKDEPTDGTSSSGVYPTGIHAHGAVTPTRKRPASETVSQADSSFYEQQNTSVHSPSKVQRLSSTGESPHPGDTTSNQSLMSIISGEIDESNQTAGNLNERDIDIILDYESKNTFPQQREDNSVSAVSRLPEASSSSTADVGDSFSQEGSSNTDDQDESPTGESVSPPRQSSKSLIPSKNLHGRMLARPLVTSKPTGVVWNPQVAAGWLQAMGGRTAPSFTPWGSIRLRNQNVKERMVNLEEKSNQTIANLACAVGSLETWLAEQRSEQRHIETIPPDELDAYLVEFFGEVKKPNGQDYDPKSFTGLRSYIDRFLREKGIMYRIATHPAFAGSQLAFKQRHRILQENVVQSPKKILP